MEENENLETMDFEALQERRSDELFELLDRGDLKTLQRRMEDMNEFDVAEFLSEIEDNRMPMVFRLLSKETAAEVFDYCTEILARGLANIYWNFDPDVVVVGGSIDAHHPVYLQTALKKAERYLPAPDSLHIEKARFGDDAGLVGAALLVG
jgi:hypothetical protein